MRAPSVPTWLVALASFLIGVDIVAALAIVPDAAGFTYPKLQHIFYFHAPAAWVGYLAFLVTAFCGVASASRGDAKWDRRAAASAEVGVVFTLLAIATGVIWSRQFGPDYVFLRDPKFLTTTALAATYLAYLALRRAIGDGRVRAKASAAVGLVGLVGLPLSYRASASSPHPSFSDGGSGVTGPILAMLLFSLLSFTVLYAYLFAKRTALAHVAAEVEARRVPPEGA
ncbi:MAG: cytochrome c biogenesis protein CcsA [Methanobacteriota archaeon]